MTYFGFLFLFLLLPILLLLILAWVDRRRGRRRPSALRAFPTGSAILLLVGVALLYTTPWDNYLVATGVWWYDPARVTGLTIGWVPIEEYTFFVLEPILVGLWLLWLARRGVWVTAVFKPQPHIRRRAVFGFGLLWLISLWVLLSGWQPGTYLALTLVWALPAFLIQFAFGADILWHYRRLALWTIVPMTLYLSLADALAIDSGIWTINPAQSLNYFIGGVLPVEEALFFLITVSLVFCGVLLLWSVASRERMQQLVGRVKHNQRLEMRNEK